MVLIQLSLWLSACQRGEDKGADTRGDSDTWGDGGSWETDWESPVCDEITGTAALTWTSDAGGTTQRSDEELVLDANVSSVLPRVAAGQLLALVGGALYRSADGGCAWTATDTPDGQDRTLLEGPNDIVWGWSRASTDLLVIDGEALTLSEDLGFKPMGLGVDPADGAHLRAGDDGCNIYESLDAGASWSLLFEAPVDSLSATSVVFDPEDLDHALCTQTREAVWTTVDGGDRWDQARGLGGDELTFNGAVFVPGDAQGVWAKALYPGAEARGALFHSSDGGYTWEELLVDSDEVRIDDDARLAVHPGDPAVLAFTDDETLYTFDASSGAVTANVPRAGRELQALAACPAAPGLWYLGWGDSSAPE